jgi:hypothetical protein
MSLINARRTDGLEEIVETTTPVRQATLELADGQPLQIRQGMPFSSRIYSVRLGDGQVRDTTFGPPP